MTSSRPEVGYAAESPLLERERELSAFDALLERDGGGGSGLVVVEGPPGIGKTRLLAELRERARAGEVRILAARGSDLEREFPFGVVRQLFEPILAEAAERTRLLVAAAAAARPVFEEPDPGEVGEPDVSFAALHGLYWLTVNLAGERPLLLVVDDLHWCDRPSLRFLAYLARRLDGMRTVLVAGLRTAEPGTDPVLIGELADASDALRLQPGPLSEAAVEELIRARLGESPDAPFTVACLTATGGNPLLLRQLLRSLEGDGVKPETRQVAAVEHLGPRAVSRTVLLRLHRLPPEAAAVAQAVAVLGDGADLAIVAALAALDEREVAAATPSLVRADILRAEPPLGFAHPLVRDAVYHDLPPGERELRHARAADLLREAGAPPEEVATHLLVCPRRGQQWVIDLLTDAAASARARGAAESAAVYLARALDEPPPVEWRASVLLQLGLAETLTFGPAAATHLREAWETLQEPRERAHVAAALARTLVFTASGREAVAFARRAGVELPPELKDERQALRAIELYAIPLGTGDEEAVTTLRDLVIEGAGPGARMLAAASALGHALTGAPAETCVALAREALADGVIIESDPGILPTGAAWVLVMADCEEALAALADLRAYAHRRGSLFGFLGANIWTGAALLWRGDLEEAENTLLTALENGAAWGLLRSGGAYGPAFGFAGAARILRGDLEGARQLLDPAAGDERRAESSRLTLGSRVELLLAEDRYEEALAAAEELAGRAGVVVNPGWAPWRSLKARALAGLGRQDEAIDLARAEVVHARSFGSPSVVGRALRIQGTLEGETGLDRLREAVELLERSTARLELAFALCALGAALRRQRKPTEAREHVRLALELAERCGAGPLAEQARSELYAAGGRPRRTALSGVESLTPSERRVADLAAAGRTNKQIAQSLYVTPKTVELHLSNAYRKLGIRSRRELGQALLPDP